MKKILKIFGKSVLWTFIIIISLLVICGITNQLMRLGEKDILKDDPGQLVEVDGSNMNIYTEGEGDHTIVFMSGWGTPSPMYDFRPLYEKLSDKYRIAVVEKFGYGFSDEYDGKRDLDTVLRQDREALQKAGIEAPYVLCAHSLSGLEATYWAQQYPDEVEAIIGLDMTTTVIEELESDTMIALEKGIATTVGITGINRPMLALSDMPECHSDKEKKQYIALYADNELSSTIRREIDEQTACCKKIKDAPLPTVPTIQYISGQNKENELWVKSHQEIVDASENGRLIQLECGHYVHQFESERIAEDIKGFIG